MGVCGGRGVIRLTRDLATTKRNRSLFGRGKRGLFAFGLKITAQSALGSQADVLVANAGAAHIVVAAGEH